jgi:hypothetical protein
MTDIEDRLRQVLACEAAHTQAGMLRSLPSLAALVPARPGRHAGGPGTGGRPGTLRGLRGRRWLAPAGAAVAVVAVIAGAALVGTRGQPASPVAAAPAAMPRFYVSVASEPRAEAVVHDARTGRVLSSVMLPRAEQGDRSSTAVMVAAAANDRTFAISATENLGHGEADTRVLLLRVSPTGHAGHLTVTPLHLTRPGAHDFVNGIALSPDGGKLAATIQIPAGQYSYGAIRIASLTGGYRIRTWTTRREDAAAHSPSWQAGGRYLGFTWDGHINVAGPGYAARTQVRLLDTAVPGGDILASKVLAEGSDGLGAIQSGLLARDGRSILATTARNIAGRQGRGTVIVRAVRLSVPGGAVTRIFIRRAVPYQGPGNEVSAGLDCLAWAIAAHGQHALLSCQGFGRLDDGKFTPLPRLGPPYVAW